MESPAESHQLVRIADTAEIADFGKLRLRGALNKVG
jgi:hypothetical protein